MLPHTHYRLATCALKNSTSWYVHTWEENHRSSLILLASVHIYRLANCHTFWLQKNCPQVRQVRRFSLTSVHGPHVLLEVVRLHVLAALGALHRARVVHETHVSAQARRVPERLLAQVT